MPPLSRRHFLQSAGAALAAIGLSQGDLLHQGNRYGSVLAQGKPGRKLALLVGINQYADSISSLQGCLTDVELQRELLVHRYGFNPADILILADDRPLKPTRQNILTAFETHLIQQAKPEDVVVFHFSGHGSLLLDPSPQPLFLQDGHGVNGTIVPADRDSVDSEPVNDIMGRSLFLLMRAVPTENVTMVLDSCHSGGGTRGNLRFRAVPVRSTEGLPEAASPTELAYQQRWLKTLKLTDAELNAMRRVGVAKGVAIGSAQYNQLAADAPFDGFQAGAFTYLLTRYLWQQSRNEGVGKVFLSLAQSTKDVANSTGVAQEPIHNVNPARNDQAPLYFLKPPTPFAEAVVRSTTNGRVEFWLGGLSARSLRAADRGAVFTAIDSTGKVLGEVQQESRQGLVGYGRLVKGNLSDLKPGTLLRERLRGVPMDLKLRVAIAPSWGSQQAEVKAALQAVDRLEVVAIGQPADFLLGRVTAALQKQARSPLPPVGSVGLFTAAMEPVTATFDRGSESIAEAVNRLRPRFTSLLAGRILQLAVGGDAAQRLQVQMTVLPKGGSATSSTGPFPAGTEFQVRVKNNEPRSLYIAVLTIGASGNLTLLYPYWEAPEQAALLAPGQELLTPQAGDGWQFTLRGTGTVEVMVLASTQPLRDTLKAVSTIARSRGASRSTALPLRSQEPLDIVAALLGDCDRHARSGSPKDNPIVKSGKRAIDATQLAAISTLIQVVK